MADKPYRLDVGGGGSSPPVPSRSPRPLSLPIPPPGKWYPGIDQGALPMKQGEIPLPPADKKAAAGKE